MLQRPLEKDMVLLRGKGWSWNEILPHPAVNSSGNKGRPRDVPLTLAGENSPPRPPQGQATAKAKSLQGETHRTQVRHQDPPGPIKGSRAISPPQCPRQGQSPQLAASQDGFGRSQL